MKLYKFRTVSTNTITMLANNQLWFSSIGDFNDPFEGAHILNKNIPNEVFETYKCKSKDERGAVEYEAMLLRVGLKEKELTNKILLQRIGEHDFNNFISIIRNSKITSLALNDDKKDPITENLMWSHYADGLRGFCLVFDMDSLYTDMQSSSNKAMMPIQVAYQNKPNSLNLVDFIKSNGVLGEEGESYVQTVAQTIATKSEDWAYENELRLLALDDDSFHSYESATLSEIVIGEKMTEAHKKLIIDIAKNNNENILIKEARLIAGSYNLEIIDA